MSKNPKKYVYWICDKQNCRQENCREIDYNRIIIEDHCTFCGKYIQEPIVLLVAQDNPNKKKEENEN